MQYPTRNYLDEYVMSVNDGDDITSELNAISDGDRVEIPPGSYTCDSGTDIFSWGTVSEDTALIGQGDPGDVVIDWGSNKDGSKLNVQAGNEARFENLHLPGGKDENCTIQYNDEGDLTMVGVWFTGASNDRGNIDTQGILTSPGNTSSRPASEGTLRMVRCYMYDNSNNALYISNGGQVSNQFEWRIEECVFENNNVASLRTGTSGYCRDTLFLQTDSGADVGTADTNIQRYFRVDDDSHPDYDGELTNCEWQIQDSGVGGGACLVVQGGAPSNGSMQDCRIGNDNQDGFDNFSGDWSGWTGTNIHITGSGPSDHPTHFDVVEGSSAEVPFYDKWAILRGTQDFGAGGGTEPPSDTEEELVVQAAQDTGGSSFDYSFTVDGDVRKGANAETNDTITLESDGTYTVAGTTGSGFEDNFYVDGTVSNWSSTAPDSYYTLFIAGAEVDPSTDFPYTTGDETGTQTQTAAVSLADAVGADTPSPSVTATDPEPVPTAEETEYPIVQLTTAAVSENVNDDGKVFPWDETDLLNESFYTVDTAQHRVTFDVPGIYRISVSVESSGGNGDGPKFRIWKSDGTFLPGAGSASLGSLSTLFVVDSPDQYIETRMVADGTGDTWTPDADGCVLFLSRYRL